MSSKARFRFDLRFLAIALLFCAGLLPIALMSHHVRANWVSVPTWDEWHTPGATFEQWCAGTLTVGDLFMQHNESRKFFPRLLYLTLVQFGGWDVRKEMVCVFLELCLLSALLLRLLRRTKGSTAVSALIAWSIMMFLCFAPVQSENFLWGIQLEPFFPGVALVTIALVNLSSVSFRAKTLVNSALAFAATYTFANGMLLWLLGFSIATPMDPTSRRQRRLYYALYIICASLSISCYFIGYQRPSHHPPLASLNGNFLALTRYLILWLGAYFASDRVQPFIFGIVALLFFASVVAAVCIPVFRKKDWRTFYPWLLIGTYSLFTATATAFGRLGMGEDQALASRYTVFSLFFYLALVGLLFALYCAHIQFANAGIRTFFLTNVGWLLGLMALCWIASYQKNLATLRFHRSYHAQLRRALEWIDPIPDNPDLLLILPFVDVLRSRAHLLAERGILRLPFIKEPLASQVQQSPTGATALNGRIENCQFDSKHSLVISGWAWLPNRNQRADCVVIGGMTAKKFKPFTVFGTGMPRPDLRDQFHVPNVYHAGFSRTVNPANLLVGDVAIEGWAIDLKGQKAFPLASSLIVHNEAR